MNTRWWEGSQWYGHSKFPVANYHHHHHHNNNHNYNYNYNLRHSQSTKFLFSFGSVSFLGAQNIIVFVASSLNDYWFYHNAAFPFASFIAVSVIFIFLIFFCLIW